MAQNKTPVKSYFYSESEWARLGCGPLPQERNIDIEQAQKQAHQDTHSRGNPGIDNNIIKGYN